MILRDIVKGEKIERNGQSQIRVRNTKNCKTNEDTLKVVLSACLPSYGIVLNTAPDIQICVAIYVKTKYAIVTVVTGIRYMLGYSHTNVLHYGAHRKYIDWLQV